MFILLIEGKIYGSAKKGRFMAKLNTDTEQGEITLKAIKMLKSGIKPGKIAEQLGLEPKRIYNIKNYYINNSPAILDTNNNRDISKYEEQVIHNLKHITLDISDTLLSKSLKKESSTQLMKSLGIAIDKLRLIEGKSTVNIASQIVHNLNNSQLEILKDIGKSLIKSML